ncbi:FAD-binding oxidoreductase [uncultured Aquimarina sp.]|uniref:FAD-binding oxidoreductase n=1 Tax=uncultured Aquimarina sp. TaxID=575652 RepID=UPI0026296260|nr:FAD-binding oxidoreductase [uncultured Aquimarina sp.]
MSTILKHIKNIGSWGNYHKIKSQLHFMKSGTLPASVKDKEYISHGNGRSYGDCALHENSLMTIQSNKILSFDIQKGILQCESGALLSDIIVEILPDKWFLPVTPGTKYITVGGAIAADVHGKNHHKNGCFSHHVISLKLALPEGDILNCSKNENAELFRATCGGMGLTGVILEATIQLLPIKSAFIDQYTIQTNNLKETFRAFEENQEASYTVAWIDALAKKANTGKGLLLVGEHAKDNNFEFSFRKKINVPTWFPSFLLNPWSIAVYNKYYYRSYTKTSEKVSLDSFFYPLDAVDNWNRIYGSKGFLQYQVVIPKKNAYQGIMELLDAVVKSNHVSYLTVLKLLGKENENYLSFPLEGYTIAMDFKIKKGVFDFLNQLDKIVVGYEGRGYLAKDARMSKAFFETGYPKLVAFKNIRKQYKLERLQSLQSKRLGL